jgi:hypothetical protein
VRKLDDVFGDIRQHSVINEKALISSEPVSALV